MSLGQAREEVAEPVVEANPQLVRLALLLRYRLPRGLLLFTIFGFAAIGHRHAAVILQPVIRLRAHAVALKKHRQARLLVPGALIAFQIHLSGRLRTVHVTAGTCAPGDQ